MKVEWFSSAVAKRRVAACHRDAMKIYEQAGTRGTIKSNDAHNITTFSTLLIIIIVRRTSDLYRIRDLDLV